MMPSALDVLTTILAFTGLLAVGGLLLQTLSRRFQVDGSPLVAKIDACLPQTQCGQCGHPGCRPYAEAIAAGEAINKCPPGGAETIAALAELLGVEAMPLDETHGTTAEPMVAVIDEDVCIGCTKCIAACPVDAILGASKRMHTVIADECTGCDLCLAPCPVDCITLIPRSRPANRISTPSVGRLAHD
ncbi:MAG: electron transport complex subunit RsxB [Litorivicinaceae bacterium]